MFFVLMPENKSQAVTQASPARSQEWTCPSITPHFTVDAEAPHYSQVGCCCGRRTINVFASSAVQGHCCRRPVVLAAGALQALVAHMRSAAA